MLTHHLTIAYMDSLTHEYVMNTVLTTANMYKYKNKYRITQPNVCNVIRWQWGRLFTLVALVSKLNRLRIVLLAGNCFHQRIVLVMAGDSINLGKVNNLLHAWCIQLIGWLLKWLRNMKSVKLFMCLNILLKYMNIEKVRSNLDSYKC